MNPLLDRLLEPSTWAGLAILATVAGLPAEAQAAAAVAAVLLRERGKHAG